MKMRGFARSTGVFLLGFSLLAIGGCGYKNAPIPPAYVVPQAIEDLRYDFIDSTARLTWSYPVKTIRGSQLEEISSFDLYRAAMPVEEYCPTCPIPFAEPISVDGGPAYDGNQRRQASYETSMLQPGYKYFFKVRSRTSWWADSDDSNVVTFVWFKPAAAPAGLTARPADGQVKLSWQPAQLPSGSEPGTTIKYQVLRSMGGKDFTGIGEPQDDTSYVDRQVVNGQQYAYKVQSMTALKNSLSQGGTTAEVTATPVDLTPPPPPTGVTAVKTDQGIKVFWNRVEEEEIAGYRVYRRPASRDSFELLAKVEPQFTLYVDTTAEPGVRYYYAVTAVDRAPSANESPKSKEATIR